MNKKLLENLLSLYAAQVFHFIVPLLLIPYLTRVLGPAGWGAFALAEAFAYYAAIVIEYGFSLSATREIARAGDNAAFRSAQLSGVVGAQVVLAGATIAVTGALTAWVDVFSAQRHLIWLALIWAIGRGLAPLWYFQGLERMRVASACTVSANLIAAAGTLLVVQTPGDAWKGFALRAACNAVATVGLFALVSRETRVVLPSVASIWYSLREGGSLFLFRGASSLYTTVNVLILGIVAPATSVALFAGAERIARAAITGIQPIVQAFYPRINQQLASQSADAVSTMRLSAGLTLGAGFGASLALFFGAPLFVRLLLGPGFEQSLPLLRILAVLPPVVAASNVLGIQRMLPLRLDREFNTIIVVAGALNIVTATLLARSFREYGMTISVLAAEGFVTAAMLVVLRRKRRDSWTRTRNKEMAEAKISEVAV